MQISTPFLALAMMASLGETNTLADPPPEKSAETIMMNGGLPGISIWTDRKDAARRGERVRVFFETGENTYVTVFRIDTDGRVSVLFPLGPGDHGFARGGRRYEVRPYSGRYAFTANDMPGEGYVFAAASLTQFDYRALAAGTRWHYEGVGHNGRVVGDPYVAAMDLIDLVAPHGSVYPSYDIVPYYVDEVVDYPRFVCYECHGYLRAAAWDPYRDPCYKFRLTVYDDRAYYPARIRNGSRVVFNRSDRLEPRFVFTERIGSEPDIDVKHRRPENRMERRPVNNQTERNRVRNRPNQTRDRAETPRRLGG